MAISGVGIYFLPYTLPSGDEDQSETHPALQALTVSGRQEDTASCNIHPNVVSVVTETQSAGKEVLIDLTDLTWKIWKNFTKEDI